MSDSTVVYRPEFFFVADSNKFTLKRSMTIGRSDADLIVNDSKLSSKHCQINLSGMVVSVKDLGSTNGVYVNGQRLPVDQEQQLKVGDRVRMGSHEYVLRDQDKGDVVKSGESFKFNPMMLVNFFDAHVMLRVLYVVVILMGVIITNLVLKVPSPFPSELEYLRSLGRSYQLRAMLVTGILFYGICLFNAFASKVHLKRSKLMRSALLVTLLFTQLAIMLVVQITYDLQLRSYTSTRSLIYENPGQTLKAEVLKRFNDNFEMIKGELPSEQRPVFESDHKNTIAMTATNP